MKKLVLTLLSIFIAISTCTIVNAQNFTTAVTEKTVENKWIEVQSIVLPFELPVNSGVTTKGNLKYWFTFDKIGGVTLSVSNYKKYSAKTEHIELVKWQKGSKYKYTTRAKDKDNVDLNKLFKNNLEN